MLLTDDDLEKVKQYLRRSIESSKMLINQLGHHIGAEAEMRK